MYEYIYKKKKNSFNSTNLINTYYKKDSENCKIPYENTNVKILIMMYII